MKILLIRSNPRKDGHTQKITDLVVKGIKKGGAELHDIDLLEQNISLCKGCFHCWSNDEGKCIITDDMDKLLKLFIEANIVLLSTPLYHFTMSCEMAKFLERALPLMKQGFQTGSDGYMRNTLRYPENWKNKGLGYIAAGAFKSKDNFDALKKTFELVANGMYMHLCAEIIRPESFLLPFTLARPVTIKTIETSLEKAGIELATNGMVSSLTIDKIASPLSISVDNYIKYSNIYWEHLLQGQKEGLDQNAIQDRVIRDIRVLMEDLSTYIDPEVTKKVKAKYQFNIPDKGYKYLLKIDCGKCTLELAESDDWDIRITVNSDIWASIFLREISPRNALIERKIKLEGEKHLFSKLDRFFPPPSY